MFDFQDRLVKLVGPLSVFARSLAICAREDDGGRAAAAGAAGGTAADAGASGAAAAAAGAAPPPADAGDGNAGPVIAAGVIGISAAQVV